MDIVKSFNCVWLVCETKILRLAHRGLVKFVRSSSEMVKSVVSTISMCIFNSIYVYVPDSIKDYFWANLNFLKIV